jgi:lipopolysaccharide transport system ATP-binding protein
VLAVGDAEFQRKCLGKMNDVAQEGRTVLFVSHNMSAILRLTEETLVLEHGHLILRAPSTQAVDYYLSSGFSQEGERVWTANEIPANSHPFKPVSVRVVNENGITSDTIRSVERVTIDIEYEVERPINGLRVGIYLLSTRGEFIMTSFDTDDQEKFENYSTRPQGRYHSRCVIPPNFLNEGRFVIGVNANSYRIKRYFQDEQALIFNVDGTGAPGMQWPEARPGPVRPLLNWSIETS